MRMNKLAMTILMVAAPQMAAAQEGPTPAKVIAAPAEPDAIPLYPDKLAGVQQHEDWAIYNKNDYVVRNVTNPTITPFLPDPAKATGSAVIVAPGGAFAILAIDPEGWRVARALADRGIAAFVLKYRVMPTPADEKAVTPYIMEKIKAGLTDPTRMPTLQYPPSTDDGLSALALVRKNAAKWNVDPKRVGMIGFSAGAMTTLNTVLAAKPGQGPNFFGYIYGPLAAVPVPENAPPMFTAITYDDVFFPTMGFPIVEAWHKAKVPVEVHAYGKGGHGFGLGIEGTTTTGMLAQFVAWIDMIGFGRPTPTK